MILSKNLQLLSKSRNYKNKEERDKTDENIDKSDLTLVYPLEKSLEKILGPHRSSC